MSRYVGIDLGLRTKHRATVFNDEHADGKPFAVDVSREDFEHLLSRSTKGTDEPVTFVMEPTGLAWLPLAAFLSSHGHRVFLPKPQKVSDLRNFYKKHTKTDAVDASILARIPQLDPQGLNALEMPTAEQTSLRRKVKRYERLMCEVADQKRRIHALLILLNPLFIAALGEEKFGRAAIAFLRKYADPAKVVKMGIGKFKSFWRRHSKGQETQERAEKIFQACQKVEELHRDLREKGKLPFDYSIMQDELNFELDRMALAESDAHKVHLEIQELYHKIDPKRTLETIVGIGPTIAPCIEALVGNIERFSNGKKFVSYAGLAPRKSKSGLSDPAMPITKTGQPILRKYFYLAADVARQYDPELAAYYARRYVAGDHHNHIVIALARKMAWRVYAILKRRSEYRRTQKEQGENKTMKPAQYILRTADGKEVEKKEARKLIVENYARKVVAPERDARDRSQKGKKEAVKSAKKDELSSIKANRKSRASELQQLINGIVDATKF